MKKILFLIILFSIAFKAYAVEFDYKKVDSITIKSIYFSNLFFARYSVNKSKFDILHAESKRHLIIKLQNKESIIMFCTILNHLKKEDVIIGQNGVYYREKLKKLSDTIIIKRDIERGTALAKDLVKIKGKYYLYYPANVDPLEVRCKIDIYEKGKHYILWASKTYIDIENNRYRTSETLSKVIRSFAMNHWGDDKATMWDEKYR